MVQLDRSCSEDDGNNALCDRSARASGKAVWVGWLESILTVTDSLLTLRLIRDNRNVLYGRTNAQCYEECPGDILAASGLGEDIRDAPLEYQVGDNKLK